MNYSKEDIVNAISNMTILEINELISMIEIKFSVSSTNIIEKNNEELKNNINDKNNIKNNFDLYLKSIGNNKISIIKLIRSITNLGLKESKDLVESCPTIIKKNISKDDIDKIKKLFDSEGAIIEFK